MNYSKETTCMFTGHRDIMSIEPEHMSRLAPEIYKAIALGKTTFLCGGAKGWDTYTAFYTVHEQADSIIMLNTKFYKGCYFDCDRYMIDNSDMLLWLGSESSHISEYAREQNKSVIMLQNKAMVL